jgi:hypothetical protein
MNLILEILKFTTIYIDDLLVASSDAQTHQQHLEMLFKKLKNAGFTMNLSKSQFLKSQIKCLGHIVTPEAIFVDPHKTKAINDFPAPKNLMQFHSFLGICGYVRRFVPNIAIVGAPRFLGRVQNGDRHKKKKGHFTN